MKPDVFFNMQDDRSVLMESYLQFREIYIRLMSLESWGEACPGAVRIAIGDMRNLMRSVYMYIGEQAVSSYQFEKRQRELTSGMEALEREKKAALEHMHKQEGGAQ